MNLSFPVLNSQRSSWRQLLKLRNITFGRVSNPLSEYRTFPTFKLISTSRTTYLLLVCPKQSFMLWLIALTLWWMLAGLLFILVASFSYKPSKTVYGIRIERSLPIQRSVWDTWMHSQP